MLKHCRDFGGTLTDAEVMQMLSGTSRNTYYKYKYEGKRKETEQKIINIREEKVKSEQEYSFLACFDKLYDNFTDLEKKIF